MMAEKRRGVKRKAGHAADAPPYRAQTAIDEFLPFGSFRTDIAEWAPRGRAHGLLKLKDMVLTVIRGWGYK